MKLVNDFQLNSEYTKSIFTRVGNKVYCKKVEDKRYRLFKKFKNATKCKKFFNDFILANPLIKVGQFYLSSK